MDYLVQICGEKQTADICNEFPDNDKNMLLNEIQGWQI